MDYRIDLLNYIIDCLKYYKDKNLIDCTTRRFEGKKREDLIELANRNNLMPILKETKVSFWEEHGKQFDNINIKNMYKSRIEMAMPVLKEFENQGIKYAILKGTYLADTAYCNMNVRSSNDIDILIQVEDTKTIKNICFSKGFVLGKSDRQNKCIIHYKRSQEVAFSLNTHQIATMVKIGTNQYFDFYDTVLDCNFSLFWGGFKGNAALTSDFLEHRIKFVDSNGFSYYVLEPEYNLIQLCLHAYKEANGFFFVKSKKGLCLRAFVDIYFYLIEYEDKMDWIRFIELVKKYEIEPFVVYIVEIIKTLFGENNVIRLLSNTISTEGNKQYIDRLGLTRVITWGDIPIIERFFSEKVIEWIDENISEEEMERIKMAEGDYY